MDGGVAVRGLSADQAALYLDAAGYIVDVAVFIGIDAHVALIATFLDQEEDSYLLLLTPESPSVICAVILGRSLVSALLFSGDSPV